jgi:RNA polymerase sigma-70 factor, ECF subfamily
MRINDQNFIKHLKMRNEKALDFVIDSYGGLIKSIVRKHLYRFENQYDECINDILFTIWQNIDAYDESKGSFSNWLAAISKYKCIDYKRKNLKIIRTSKVEDFYFKNDENADQIIENELHEDIENLISKLSQFDKEIFMKYYFEDKDIAEISNDMSIKPSAIYNRLSRGRNKLRNIFKFETKL